MTSQGNGRGPRRPRGGSRRRGGDDRRSRPNTPPRPPVKKSFFETITDTIKGFLGGNGSPPIARPPVARDDTPRSNGARSEQPQRQDRPERERTQRKPESVEVTTPRLYVGNLSFEATESDLFELFNGVGKVQNAEVVTYKHNQRSKGFAFVQMLTVEEAQRAVTELHDKDFLGRKLVVSGAKSTEHSSSLE